MNGVTRFRPTKAQLMLQCGPLLALPVFLAVRDVPRRPVDVLLALAVCAAVTARVAGSGADARPDGLLVRGLRHRLVPWSSITRIEPARELGGWAVTVVAGPKTYRLRAPQRASGDPETDFARALAELHRYWGAYRGAAWQPPPPWGVPATG